MELRSQAFDSMASIPRVHTCEGDDVSPPLTWSGAPSGSRSFALIVDDPDAPDPNAPQRTWVHWVVYNLPAEVTELAQGASGVDMPDGAREGSNDWKQVGWQGPCPPIGRHRYFHKLYALDDVLPDLGAATKAELERAMAGHILASAELIGTYQKER